ncbi:bromodomain adjacent to zinc finger domain protein 2A [Neosynchiropus ocellatus]
MEANDHFNYGSPPSTNSGLKLSSGDSHYSNGSSMSFSQQGKNMNGEMNVNGTSTVAGSGVAGSHPPAAPFPNVSNHHPSNMGYDYRWGGHPQYGPAMSPGLGTHQKQLPPGPVQSQPQHQFQDRGQYQLNGEGSLPPPVTGSANMSLAGSQYWNRNSPGPQSLNYNSHSMYGTYQGQTHPVLSSSQHHQQQPPHSAANQLLQQHLQSHRQPHHLHQQQYGMMPNGMPYYQHQPQQPSLQSSTQQQMSKQPLPLGPSQLMHPGPRNFSPLCDSPLNPRARGPGSPLPAVVSSASMLTSPNLQDKESAKTEDKRSPSAGSLSSSFPGRNIVDSSYNGTKKALVPETLPKKSPHSDADMGHKGDFHQSLAPSFQKELLSPLRDSAETIPPLAMSSKPPEASSSSVGLPPSLTPKTTATISSSEMEPSQTHLPTPSNVSSATSLPAPPKLFPTARVEQEIRPLPASTEISPEGSKHHSPPLAAIPKLHADDVSRPSAGVSVPSRSLESVVHQIKSTLTPSGSEHLSFSSPNFPPSHSAPISSLQQMVQGSMPPLISTYRPDAKPLQHGASKLQPGMSPGSSMLANIHSSNSGPPMLMPTLGATTNLSSYKSASELPSVKTPVFQSSGSALNPQRQTPPALDPGPSLSSVDPLTTQTHSSGTPHESSAMQPLSTLPLRTTQASRTAPLSAPPALVSVTSALKLHPPNATSLSQQPEHQNNGEGWKSLAVTATHGCLSDINAGAAPTLPDIKSAGTQNSEVYKHKSVDLPRIPFSTSTPERRRPNRGPFENMDSGKDEGETKSSSEVTAPAESACFTGMKAEHTTANKQMDHSSHSASQLEYSSACAAPSELDSSTALDETMESETSLNDNSSYFDNSQSRDRTSQYNSTFNADEDLSTPFDTTQESNSSVESSGDHMLGNEAETSKTGDILDSSGIPEESMLGSSQTEKHQVDSSVPVYHQNQVLEADSESKGFDTADSAGCKKAPLIFKMTSFKADKSAADPLQPATPQVLSAPGGRLKSPGRPRKVQTQNAAPGTPGGPQRSPRVRTPKVRPEDDVKEKGVRGRKRKQSAGVSSDVMDSISATIEAVLASTSTLSTTLEIPQHLRKIQIHEKGETVVKLPRQDADSTADDVDDNEDSYTTGEPHKRRVATEEQVKFPLMHGWRREIRVRKTENRLKGETWYYTPCGRRMKQFPEIIKYLKKHPDGIVTREHFSFSPRMPVGDYYIEKETPEGMKWLLLANEEIPSMIMAITGRRGRPPNPDKPVAVRPFRAGPPRRPGRPPKLKMIDLLSKVDAKLLNRLEAKETLTEEEKVKMAKIKKKMKKKARMKRREDAKIKKMKEEKKRAKLEQEIRHLEMNAGSGDPNAADAAPVAEPKRPGRRRATPVEARPAVQQTDEERIAQGKRVLGARSKAKAIAKAQADAEAAAQAARAAKRSAERRMQAQRRLEERKRQQLITEELRKPAEDMCLTDHKPLPELSRIQGLVLSGSAFAHLLTVVEFLHGYGKLIGLNVPKDIPALGTLQEGLLGLGDSQGEVLDLLIKLMDAALHDPGLPSFYQSVKILGDKLADLQLTRSTVSEVLRIFLESYGFESEVCNTLRTKPFHALNPDTKAAILAFVVDELNSCNIVTNDIDNTMENMSTYRKNKWVIEGKLRKLKAALARRTGRSEEELCFEERRRSARVAEEENLNLEESGVLPERSSRRSRKEEPKISDSESPTTASIPELERQIDKLTKRQAFFRKKLQQSSHSMRAIMLGQDRYRRRYLALPHLGGVLVEGPVELLTSGEVLVADVPVTFFKKEVKTEESPIATSPPLTQPSSPSSAAHVKAQFSEDDDPLPGTASLMSRPRGRGRPRKIKPEVELHLRTAKIRRRRRSSVRSGGADAPQSPDSGSFDLTQTSVQGWNTQSEDAMTNGAGAVTDPLDSGAQPDESVKEMAEKRGQWFNLLPKEPCDDSSLSESQAPSSPPKLLPQVSSPPSAVEEPQVQTDLLSPPTGLESTDPVIQTAPENESTASQDVTADQQDVPTAEPGLPSMQQNVSTPPENPTCPQPTPPVLLPATNPVRTPVTPNRPGRRRRRGSRGSSPARRGPRGPAAKRRGRPPNSMFQELEQQYFTQLVVKPIPTSMVRGWWWIKDPEELYSTLQALHPRGIREKVLHKHLAKHMESLAEMCKKSLNDSIFDLKEDAKDGLLEVLQQPWQVQDKAMETDIDALKWVEDLEQRVLAADLQLKAPPQSAGNDAESNTETPIAEFLAYTVPDPDSSRDDLQYYEHEADPRDDWIVRTKKEWSGLPRIATHPLDLAVLRLANLERNIERRYLKEPLWNPAEVMKLAPLTPTPGEEEMPMDASCLESEITSRLRTWRQALDRVRSAPQVCLCLAQLERAIAWERSVTKVTCQVCRKGDNDDCLLLCDGCDRGCHMYCLKPKITRVPEGDWFCPHCVAKEASDSPRSSKKRTRVKRKRYEEGSSDEDVTPRRTAAMATRHKEPASSSTPPRSSGDAGAAKRRRMTTRNQPDLTFCEIILMEMEAHADAWPFLEPVNPRLVPGYRRIIKNPMDFLTMRERLLQGGYCSHEEFAADAQLVFNNCELFNEDTSEVGVAGHSMRRFFESRWAEFYSNKDK